MIFEAEGNIFFLIFRTFVSYIFIFQNFIGLKRYLHSEAVEINVYGFLTYTTLALFFVH